VTYLGRGDGIGGWGHVGLAIGLAVAAGIAQMSEVRTANNKAYVATVSFFMAAVMLLMRYRPGILATVPHGRADLTALVRDGFGLGLVFHAASIWLGWVLIAAVDPGTATHTVEVLAILAIARLSVVLPISPAGLGVQEAAVGVLFAQVGLDPGVALAAILLNRVALLVVVLLGTVGWLSGGRAPRAAGSDAASEAPGVAGIAPGVAPGPAPKAAATPRRPLALAAWDRARRD